jgi:hypothetical protein
MNFCFLLLKLFRLPSGEQPRVSAAQYGTAAGKKPLLQMLLQAVRRTDPAKAPVRRLNCL